MQQFKAKFYNDKTGRLLEEVMVNGKPITRGERIPNVADLALVLVTKVEPAKPKATTRGLPVQKVWVREVPLRNPACAPVPLRM